MRESQTSSDARRKVRGEIKKLSKGCFEVNDWMGRRPRMFCVRNEMYKSTRVLVPSMASSSDEHRGSGEPGTMVV